MNALIERLTGLNAGEVNALPATIPQTIVERPRPHTLCDLPRIAPPPVPVGRRPYRLGTALWDPKLEFCLHPAYTNVHMAVLGESGSGKSKFLEQYSRCALLDLDESGCPREAVMLIDPDKDLANNVLAFVAHRLRIGDGRTARRCHLLTIEEDLAFRFDPFASLPRRLSLPRDLYYSRLDALVERLIRQLHRRITAEELEVMNRLKPRLKAVLTACAIDHDGRGLYHGMAHASALANPANPRFRGLLDQAFPHLPEEAQDTFREIMADRLTGGVLDKWESTQNRLASFLNPLMKLCLGRGPSVDFARGIANKDFFFVRIGQNRSVSFDTANKMAGLVMDAFIQVKEGEEDLPPHRRNPATVIIDEAGDFIAEDLCMALRKDRKLDLKFVLGAQNYITLCNSDLAMGDYVLSQCGTVVCFAQRLANAGREIMADRLFAGNVRCTKRMVEVQMQRGWLQTRTIDASVSGNKGTTWSETEASGRTDAESKTRARQRGVVLSEGESDAEVESIGHADNFGSGESMGSSSSHTETPILVGTMIVGNAPVLGTAASSGRSFQAGHSNSFSLSHNRARSRSRSETDAATSGTGHSIALSRTSASGKGGSEGEGWTLSLKTGLMPNVVSEWRWDGTFEEGSVTDQKAIHQKWLHCLKTAECFVSVLNVPEAFPVKIDRVREKWETPDLKWAAIQLVIRLIAAQHPYTFSPCDRPEEPLIEVQNQPPDRCPKKAPVRRRQGGFND